jgi:uncharacterized surface protein with fasciclin (FAS1) repeats
MKKQAKHIVQILCLALSAFAMVCVNDSCNLNDDWKDHYEKAPARVSDNVLALIGENENYSRFYDALIEYGYDDLLSKNQYFTVFVPVNSAFDGLPELSEDEWKNMLGFHILYAKLLSFQFSDLDLLTIIGKYLNMRVGGNNDIDIFDSRINLNNVDMHCQNGVIHEIDKLLLPKPNVYEYIMALDSSYSIIQDFLLSQDERYVDYENSERVGVDDNGNAVYDTVWLKRNYFLDNIAGLNNESRAFTGFIPANEHVRAALSTVSEYFGNIGDLDQQTYAQVLFITFSGSFMKNAYRDTELPDSIVSVTGKVYSKSLLNFSKTNQEVSNGIVHLLSDMALPKSFFLVPIIIECDRKQNRKVSNTIYPIEQLSDTRATNGTYVYYNCQFPGDYIEFTVKMVLKTTYWFVWTGPRQGPSTYQLSVKDENTGEFVFLGEPVDNWAKGWFNPVVSGTYTFNEFGTKTVRINIVDELPIIGLNSIYIDYIKLIPDEVYNP